MWRDKNARKRRSSEGSYQGSLQRRCYTGGRIKGTTKNIGVGWREIGNDGRAGDRQEKRR